MEVTIISYGDSNNINVWSNFPYFICKGFEENKIVVNRVNLLQFFPHIEFLFDNTITKLVKLFDRKSTYSFYRSTFYLKFLSEYICKKVIRQYPNSDFYISLNFDICPNKYTKKTCINMCDWTYEFSVKKDINKQHINFLERKGIKNQNDIIFRADIIVCFRKECSDFLKQTYTLLNIIDYEFNAVNCDIESFDEKKIISDKLSSNSVTFLGSSRYKYGASELVKAINYINNYRKVYCIFIGLEKKDLEEFHLELNENMIFYGKLDKNDTRQRNLYYNTILSSRICVNTNPGFVSIASIQEAIYLYTPVIISKHLQTITALGDDMQYGLYTENTASNIVKCIDYFFSLKDDEYVKQCLFNHNQLSSWTWHNAIKQFLCKVNEKNHE